MRIALLIPALSIALAGLAQYPAAIKLNQWATGITRVTDIAHCGDSRLFVTQQVGVIKIILDSNQVASVPFLDIQTIVNDAGNEQGLLGMVFDPDYINNGYFYLNYTAGTGNGVSRISRWTVSPDSSLADPASEEILYQWTQPFSNHNGGDLDFGPDGNLYVAFGDGGSGGDPQGNAQDLTDPLGDMIRIHVSDPDTTYTIPADNPFATATDTLREIWASGLRNPYRFGFDKLTGDLWIGDVGQNAWEEVDFWPAGDNSGPNFGWRCYEGNAPYNTAGCQPFSSYETPVVVHENVGTGGDWCSVIGGRVYRGSVWPHLYGLYVYTDYCGQEFRTLRPNGLGGWIDEQVATTTNTGYAVIAEDAVGELFTGNNANGRVYKIVDKCPMDPPSISFDGVTLSSTVAISYTWYLNGVAIPGGTTQNYVPTVVGVYHVLANLGGGCLLPSDTIEVTVIDAVGEFLAPVITISPVPAHDQVQLQLMNGASQIIQVVDASGRIYLRPSIAGSGSMIINVTTWPAGSYAVQAIDQFGSVYATQRLVVAH